jgi:membrane protease YdiL (CAAX protease family)
MVKTEGPDMRLPAFTLHMTTKKRASLEVFIGLLLIFGYEWIVYSTYPSWLHAILFIAIFGLLFNSKQSHRETMRQLGFRLDTFSSSAKSLLLPFVVLLIVISIAWGFFFPVNPWFFMKSGFWTKLFIYPFWALFQQYIALAFFFRRLKEAFFPRVFPAMFISALIFSAAHIPNFPLMIFCFIAGLLWAWAFHRHNNLFTVALFHGVLGSIGSSFLLIYTLVGPYTDANRWTKHSHVNYSLDAIYNVSGTKENRVVKIGPHEKNFTVKGWAKATKGKIKTIYICLDGKAYVAKYGLERKDVEKYYNNPDFLYSGFQGVIPISHLKPGTYLFSVKIKLADQYFYHYPGWKIWIKIP